MAAKADVALQSTLREAAQEEMDAYMAEIAELLKLLTDKSAKLSQSSAMHSEWAHKLSRVKAKTRPEQPLRMT